MDVNAMLGVGVIWGMGNRRYCTMYKKILYNIKKMKKCGVGEGGQYLNPKHSLCI